jgi:iron complex outermembrane recepter protein
MSKVLKVRSAVPAIVRQSLLLPLGFGLALGANVAGAQEQSAGAGETLQLEEIIVTAQRRSESLQDVPISVTAFSSEAITNNMFQGVDDYFVRVPNVSFTSTGSRDRKELSIRGVANQLSPDLDVRPNTFGFYIDDFNVASGTVNPPIMDIERIEVLRGPQGTYFGKNAVGGAINITTKKPSNELEAEGMVDYSRYDTRDLEGIVNVPVLDDKLAIRANVKWRESDGNIRNINPIGGGNDSSYKNGRVVVRYTPTDRLTIDLTGSYTDEEVGMREGVPTGALSVFERSLYHGGDPNAVADPDGVGFYPHNTNRVNFNRKQSVGSEFYYLTSRIQYDFDELSLVSISGYIDAKGYLEGDIDGGSVDAFYETKPLYRDSTSQELRLQTTGERTVDWTVGAYVGRDRGHTDQHTFAGGGNPFGLPDGFEVTSSLSSGKSESVALFGEGTWHVTEKLGLTTGLRYTSEKVEIAQVNTSSGAANNVVSDDASFSDVSPRFSATYEFNDDLTSYVTVSRGFKSGGVQIGPQLNDAKYDPEVLWNYEVGTKVQLLDHRLRLNLAGFYMKWDDLQTDFVFGVVDENNNISFVTGIENAASARSYGAEFEMNALVTPNFRVNAGVGYLNAEFKEFRNAFIEGQQVDLTGYRLPNAPEWTASADAEYSYPITAGLSGFVRTEWFYRDKVVPFKNALVLSGFPWEVPAYDQWNLRAGVQGDRYSVTAYVENLTDDHYYTNAYQKAFIGGVYVEPAYRTYGIRLTYRMR